MKIQTVDIKEVTCNPDNPRTISESKLKSLIESIKEFPEMLSLRPIVVDADLVAIGGNKRLEACRAAGLTEVNIVVADNLSEEQKKEFIIKDNLSFGEWDFEKLAADWDKDLLDSWGFDLLDEIEDEIIEGKIDEDSTPEIEGEIISQLGKIYKLGNHRLMCGDSTKEEDVAELMGGEKADMVFTDPPYGIDYQSNMRTKSEKFDVIKNDNTELEFMHIIDKFSTGWVFIWTAWKVVDKWLEKTCSLGYPTNMIIWFKGGGGIGDLNKTFSTDYEVALVFNRGSNITGKRLGSVWSINKDGASSYKHPTQKPVELSEMALNNTTIKQNIILDLFGGSGSTLISCEKTNRKCYMMELDKHYCDVIRKRWAEYVHGEGCEWQSFTPAI